MVAVGVVERREAAVGPPDVLDGGQRQEGGQQGQQYQDCASHITASSLMAAISLSASAKATARLPSQ